MLSAAFTKQLWFRITLAIILILLLSAGVFTWWVHTEYEKLESDDPTVWEPVIRDFEKEDQEHPPLKNAVLFIGSSSIRFWRGLEKSMHPIPVIKRGFGGSKIKDIIYYADRIVFPYRPKAIVLFAGTNDISGRANDKTPEGVLHDFVTFARLVERKLPGCQLFYLPITPTTSRWEIWPQANKANELIKAYMDLKPNLHYLDVTHYFLNEDGKPKDELLWWDGVHLNNIGYKVWEMELKNQLQNEIHTTTNTDLVDKDNF